MSKEKGKLIESPHSKTCKKPDICAGCGRCQTCWGCECDDSHPVDCKCRECCIVRQNTPAECGNLPLCEWVQERYENCLRLAETKTGTDRDGWLNDADYFRQILAELREFSQHPVPASIYRPSEDLRKAFADSIVDILWDRRELDSRNNTRQKCVDIVMSAFAQYGKVVLSEGEHPVPAPSRSVQRRIAAQKGEPAPTFEHPEPVKGGTE